MNYHNQAIINYYVAQRMECRGVRGTAKARTKAFNYTYKLLSRVSTDFIAVVIMSIRHQSTELKVEMLNGTTWMCYITEEGFRIIYKEEAKSGMRFTTTDVNEALGCRNNDMPYFHDIYTNESM